MECGGLEEQIHEVAVREGREICAFLSQLVMFVKGSGTNKPL